MIPASVFLRSLAVAAFLLPAAGLRAQDASLPPGALDTSFANGLTNASVYAIDYEVDPADPANPTVKITAGGDRFYGQYYVFPGDGSTSPNFVLAPFGNAARIIYTIVPEVHPVGDASLPNLLFGGLFGGGVARTADKKPVQNIIRITPDGAIDQDFAARVGFGANNYVTSILPLDDGRIVVGGLFTTFNRAPRRRIVRLQNTGDIDSSFATGSNIDNDVLALAESIAPPTQDVPARIDNNIYVGGTFNRVAGQAYGKLVRLNSNGDLDMSFHPSIDLRVLAILVQPDGKIVIGGDFTTVNGQRVSRLARLQYDGSLDTSFVGSVSGVPNKDVNPTGVYVLKPIADGRIYVGGEFAQINGVTRQYLGVISADGVLDPTFDPGTNVRNSVQSIAIQTQDNKILVGETLSPRINNQYPPSLIRLYGVTPVTAQ